AHHLPSFPPRRSSDLAFAPASTPFFTTDQNGSEACPCVTTAMLIASARRVPASAAAGEPSMLRPAAARPPLTKSPRRVTWVSSRSEEHTSELQSRFDL